MDSLILRTASRFLLPLLLLFSVFLLLRGHNEPGGGFVGGLTAAGGFVLYAMANDVAAARKVLRFSPLSLLGTGLLLATLSGVFPLFAGLPYLTGAWVHLKAPLLPPLDLGTPILFDVGVYLVVVGSSLLIVFSLEDE